MQCFKVADTYLRGFLPVRSAIVTGNHDLEGAEFETDVANLAAWTQVGAQHQLSWTFRLTRTSVITTDLEELLQVQVFKQRHYWSMELGNVVCLGISTVRFRSNAFRCASFI